MQVARFVGWPNLHPVKPDTNLKKVGREMVGGLIRLGKIGEPIMIDAICIPLPSGLVIEMRARAKGVWSRSGTNESYEELWTRFQTAVRSEDFASFVKLYGKTAPPNVALARVQD